MSTVQPLVPATDKAYACTNCGNTAYSIVRQDAKNPRLKCSSCNFVYNGEDSLSAGKRGEIPESSPETLAAADDPDQEIAAERKDAEPFHSIPEERSLRLRVDRAIPRTPKFVFIAKNRKHHEFSTAKDVKTVALRWEADGLNYEVFELAAKEFEVNVNIK